MSYSKAAGAKIERDLAWRLAGYQARIEAGKGLLACEWDDMERIERHFKAQELSTHVKHQTGD